MATVPKLWPSAEVIEGLVKKLSGYFIYTSTVIRFMNDTNFHPIDPLNTKTVALHRHLKPWTSFIFKSFLLFLGIPGLDSSRLTVIAEQLLDLEMGDFRLILVHQAEIDADHKFLIGNNREYLRINGSKPEIQIGRTTLLCIAIQRESLGLSPMPNPDGITELPTVPDPPTVSAMVSGD
ncbi:hypothetical protein B0H14DRAFT_2578903 [Mycena olivaceomarginata]|nr:hypothetical protein B0H14DRAFT_2578903 [Mycena olivaceomarginata]